MREPGEGDARIVSAAQAALLEVTGPETVGPLRGLEETVDGVVDVRFTPTMDGYPGWHWVVSVSVLDGTDAPSVLELGLLPADGALTAPEWVPWSERLADYRAAQEAKGEAALDADDADEDDSDEDDDAEDLDDSDDELGEDVDEIDLLGDGDDPLDGVDFEHDDDDDASDEDVASDDDNDASDDDNDPSDADDDLPSAELGNEPEQAGSGRSR